MAHAAQAVHAVVKVNKPMIIDVEQFSNINRLLNMIAYVFYSYKKWGQGSPNCHGKGRGPPNFIDN